MIEWACKYVDLDPVVSYRGEPALPIEYIEGEWSFGHSEAEAAAVIVYATDPSPETGHVGWCWWALGKMGDAPTLAAARAAAEEIIGRMLQPEDA